VNRTPSSSPDRRTFIASGAAGLLAARARGDEPPLAPPDKQPPDVKLPDPPPKSVGWAIVGLGKLALEEILPAFAGCKRSKPTALVSGHPDKAKRVAAAYNIDPKHIYDYDSYDKLKDDPTVDVVYVVLPNSMHAEYTIRALKAGKHVLCEKPMAANPAECEQMIAAAREAKRKLMIAYRLHYEPFNQTVMKLCAEKALGDLRTIASTNVQVTEAPNIRLSKALAGGPVEDVGVYCINACRYATREEPVEVTAFADRPNPPGRFREVPRSVAFTLRFPSGVVAHCDCGFDAAERRVLQVNGTKGSLDLDPAFSYRGLKLAVMRAGGRDEPKLTDVSHFAAEMEHFSGCVQTGADPRTPGEEGLADMRVVAAIREAMDSGRAVAVKR
jgi:predicted dehydrogenase